MRFPATLALLTATLCAGSVPALAADARVPVPRFTDAMIPVRDHVVSARLYAPADRSRYPVVVLMPGSGSESVIDSPSTVAVAGAFARQGIGALAYDKRGVGRSTGAFTGSDFAALGEDAAAVARFAAALPNVERVGLWGISQAGWVAPFAVRDGGRVAFVQLISPAGVNPFEQVAYFLRVQAAGWGLAPEAVEKADRMHRAVALYYAGRADHAQAQAEVDACRDEPWFLSVITHPYWDEISRDGRVLEPEALARALLARPDDFEIYRSRSSFDDYRPAYAALKLPTLVVYGGADVLVPVPRSRAVFEAAFANERDGRHEFRVFDGASHDIQGADGTVRADYLQFIAEWARARFDEVR